MPRGGSHQTPAGAPACCWVTVVSCLSQWPQTPVFLQVWLRPQKFPLERLSTQEWLTPNWPEHCPFISMVGTSLLSFLNTVNVRFMMRGSAPWSSPGLTLFPLEVCGFQIKHYSYSWLSMDHVAGTVLSTFIFYLAISTTVLWGTHCHWPHSPHEESEGLSNLPKVTW